MKKIYLISDSFVDDFIGGAALNDEVLFEELNKIDNVECSKIRSDKISMNELSFSGAFYIISNFLNLPIQAREFIINELNYIILEHDYKFCANRNPAAYKNFLVPSEDVINFDFYKKASNIICQSSFHKDIFDKNLNMADKTISLGGNLWSDYQFDLMRVLSKRSKKDLTTLIQSPYIQKGNHLATEVCLRNMWKYEYISDWDDYISFLIELSKNKRFVFCPITPETLSRTACEAKMMNVEFVSNNLIGAENEPWFKYNGVELIDKLVEKRSEIVNIMLDLCQR